MAQTLTRIKVGPTGMRLNEWVALEEGFYRDAGFDVDMLWEQLMAEQLGLRKVIDGELKTLWWVDSGTAPELLGRYFEAIERAEQAIQADTARYLPPWNYSNSEHYGNHPWDYNSFGRGERFVHSPLPIKDFDDIMAQVTRWGLDDHLEERAFDKITLTVK